MCGLFSATAILHGLEGTNLIHGLWYLLCLPSGYLFLTIYSIANLTDRSWGKYLSSNLLFMCGLFSATAILHGLEGTNLIHGLWYLLCLPSGYLFLTIYSIANLTDRSYGMPYFSSSILSMKDTKIF